jgi:hypothetical protein
MAFPPFPPFPLPWIPAHPLLDSYTRRCERCVGHLAFVVVSPFCVFSTC